MWVVPASSVVELIAWTILNCSIQSHLPLYTLKCVRVFCIRLKTEWGTKGTQGIGQQEHIPAAACLMRIGGSVGRQIMLTVIRVSGTPYTYHYHSCKATADHYKKAQTQTIFPFPLAAGGGFCHRFAATCCYLCLKVVSHGLVHLPKIEPMTLTSARMGQ